MNIRKLAQYILPHKINDQNHYGSFIGSFHFIRQLSWNLFHPNRIINRIRWKTLFSLTNLKIKKYKKYLSAENKDKKLLSKLEIFLNQGGVLVNKYFSKEKINNFLNEYKDLIHNKKNLAENTNNKASIYRIMDLHLSDSLIDLWLDDELVKFIECFIGNKIYAREYPRLIYTKYMLDGHLISKNAHNGKYKNTEINGPYFWHVDHSAGLVNLHILLEDVDMNSTHMQFLPESNKYFNTRDVYSDETVANFKNKLFHCIGEKGTIYFHQGNTLHRVLGRKNSSRLSLIFSFSVGAGIEMNCKKIFTLLSKNFEIKNISKEKRSILKGILPLNSINDIINGKLGTQKFSEIIF